MGGRGSGAAPIHDHGRGGGGGRGEREVMKVELIRMATAAVANSHRLFQLFTMLKERAVSVGDEEVWCKLNHPIDETAN